MKIIKTKEIVPVGISELDEELYTIFKDRTKLHQGQVPTFFAYIQDVAWNAFLEHGNNIYKSSRHEAQGILVGKYCEDEHGKFIVATKYSEGDGISTQSYVEMSEKCLAEIAEECQKEELLMLIWLHTHPGFGTFYSGTDNNCLKTNFYKEYQLGIVVDIISRKYLGYKVFNSTINEFHKFGKFNINHNKIFHLYN